MDSEELTERVLSLIEEITGDDIVRTKRDIDLFDEGLFDSLSAVEFLVDIEDVFGVTIAPTELERDEMNTPEKIIDQIKRRL